MRIAVLGGVALALLLAAPARATCTRLPVHGIKQEWPERPVDHGAVLHTALDVCAGRHRVRLRALERVGSAGGAIGWVSIAGRHVAWIEQQVHGGRRSVDVHVVTVSRSGAVRPLRTIAAQRARSRHWLDLTVALDGAGDLAWALAGRHRGPIVLARRGRAPRVISRVGRGVDTFEHGSLRWTRADATMEWYDLVPQPCPRAGFKTFMADAEVSLGRRHFGFEEEGTEVLRACDLASHRDVTVSQHDDVFPDTDTIAVAALQGARVLIVNTREYREYYCYADQVRTVDARTGRGSPWTELGDCYTTTAPPQAGEPVALTSTGAAAWVSGDRLVAAAGGRLVTLDAGGAIAGLHAEGAAVVWAHDGVPRSATPAG